MSALLALALLALPRADALLGVDGRGNPIFRSHGVVYVADLEAQRIIKRLSPRAAQRWRHPVDRVDDGRGGTVFRVRDRLLRRTPTHDTPLMRAAHAGPVTHLLAVPDTHLAISGGADGRTIIWHAPTGTALLDLPIPGAPATHLIATDCAVPTVVSAGAAGVFALPLTWPVQPRRVSTVTPRHLVAGAGCHLGVAAAGAVEIHDLQTGLPVERLTPETAVRAVDARDGALVFTLSERPDAFDPARIIRLPRVIRWTPRGITIRPGPLPVDPPPYALRALPALPPGLSQPMPHRLNVAHEAPLELAADRFTRAVGRYQHWVAAGTARGRLIFRRSLFSRYPRPIYPGFRLDLDGWLRFTDPRLATQIRIADGRTAPAPALFRRSAPSPDGRYMIDYRHAGRRITRVSDETSALPLAWTRGHYPRWLDARTLVTRVDGAVLLHSVSGQLLRALPMPGPARAFVQRGDHVVSANGNALWRLNVKTGERARWPVDLTPGTPRLDPSGRFAAFVSDHRGALLDLHTGEIRWRARFGPMRIVGVLDADTVMLHDRLSGRLFTQGPAGRRPWRRAVRAAQVPGTTDMIVADHTCVSRLDRNRRVRWRARVRPDGGRCR